ncbi:MAG: MFS transporter [Ruthenibacterium sp.]
MLASCIGLFMGYNLNITHMIQTVTARGGTSGDMGAVFAIAAALELPAMTLAGRLLRSRSAGTLMFCSGLGLTAKSLVIALSGGLAWVYAAQFLQPLGYALVIPCTVYYANRAFPPHRRLAGQTLMVAASTLGTVLSAALGGSDRRAGRARHAAVCGAISPQARWGCFSLPAAVQNPEG